MIEVRATINLSELPAGSVVTVDEKDAYMAACLRHGFLVPTGKPTVPAVPAAGVPVPVLIPAEPPAEDQP